MCQAHLGHISAIDVLLMQLALHNTKIDGIPTKMKNVFLDQNSSLSPDTQLCSNDSKHTSWINFKFSFKRKERAWKALIWQTLRKQVFCGADILMYFTIRLQIFRK